jgi:hypothetical protein
MQLEDPDGTWIFLAEVPAGHPLRRDAADLGKSPVSIIGIPQLIAGAG